MKIIGHRGVPNMSPENSLSSITLARKLGLDAIEIDVRLTNDNQLVVFHDKTLKRLAGIRHNLSDYSLSELAKIKLTSGEPIPSLRKALKLAGDLPLVIEGKDDGWAEVLANELKDYKYCEQLRVISFNARELEAFSKLRPDIETYIITVFSGFKALRLAKRYGFQGIVINYFALSLLIYKIAIKRQIKINVFTVNSPALAAIIERLFPGVDVTSNAPSKLKPTAKVETP